MILYNKLIRDKIPEIIEGSGKKCDVDIMDDETYLKYLDKKLNEELSEYYEDKSLEELSDLLEVIYAVTEARGFTIDELENVRRQKAEQRGRFTRKLLLKSVTE